MNTELNYPGRRESNGAERRFQYIRSTSSGTLERQKARFVPPGFTLVAEIPHEDRGPFREAINMLMASGHKFQAVERLHFTILGLFAGNLERPLAGADLQRLLAAIEEFFRGVDMGSIAIDFD